MKNKNGVKASNGLKVLKMMENDLCQNLQARVRVKELSETSNAKHIAVEVLWDMELATFAELAKWKGNENMDHLNSLSIATHLTEAYFSYQQRKGKEIELEELLLDFKDSSIVIHNVFPKAILNNCFQILVAIASHSRIITSVDGRVPEEISIPICLKDKTDTENPGPNKLYPQQTTPCFFDFWGVNFDGDMNDYVYNLNSSKLDQENVIYSYGFCEVLGVIDRKAS